MTQDKTTSEIAFLFPGQGSQYVGMGKLLAETYPEARRVLEEADDVLGFALSQLCFEGPEEVLKQTQNTQPALLAISFAAYKVLKSHGYRPAAVAGHSLGEYSALAAAGSIEFADALRIVRNRGQYMQEAVPVGAGAMAAILKLPEGELERILQEAAQGLVLSAANFNAPDQVVIAGHTMAVERAVELAKAAGARRAILLAVSAPFHCSLMRPAQERLRVELDALSFKDPSVPLMANWNAHKITTAAQARHGLFEQIPNPVLWTNSIQELARQGIERFVEVGPGSVLLGLCRKIDPLLRGAKFGEPADLDKVKELLDEPGDIDQIAE
jgi:[acyl-carrier-protein] S-malonyltransferase